MGLDFGLSSCRHLQLCDEAPRQTVVPPHAIRPTIWALPNVTHLEISSNLVELPSNWSTMPHIQHLDIRGVAVPDIACLENAIASLHLLRSLYVGYAAGLIPMLLKLLHQDICHIPSLSVLYIAVEPYSRALQGDVPISECKLLRGIAEVMKGRDGFQELHFAGSLGHPSLFGSPFDDCGWSGWVGILEDEALVALCTELAQLANKLRTIAASFGAVSLEV